MATSSKQKKVKGVKQKLKLFRVSDPLISILMWGVNYTMNQHTHVKHRAMLLGDDFKAYIKVKINNHFFNKEHMPSRFKFKEYCPLVFKNLRERFSIDNQDYWDAFTKQPLLWQSSKGHSGSKFLLTYNQRFIIKTISTEEVEQVHNILQSYHEYVVNCFAKTRLPQLLAMYRLIVNDQATYMLVMRYAFSPRLPIHFKYDLKGSNMDREASEKEKKNFLPTLKDVDFINNQVKISIGPEEKSKLLEVLERDVSFLQSHSLIDYSLVVGIHEHDRGSTVAAMGAETNNNAIPFAPPQSQFGQPSAPGEASEQAQAASSTQQSYYETSPAEDEDEFLGVDVDYMTRQSPPDSPNEIYPDLDPFAGELHPIHEFFALRSFTAAGKPLVFYFVSIVDILSRYGVRKRTAQRYKTVKHGVSAEISTVKPEAYARRFLEFVNLCVE